MKKLILVATLVPLALATVQAGDPEPGELFDEVVEVLADNLYDRDFRRGELPALARRFEAEAGRATSLNEEREAVHRFLAEIPASHLALWSRATFDHVIKALEGGPFPTCGFELVEIDGDFFVPGVMEGGPGESAGLRRGDRVVEIDGHSPGQSPRLDWRNDDAHLDDPPTHLLLCDAGDKVPLVVERRPGERMRLRVEAKRYSLLEAARASARVIDMEGHRLAYVHFWLVHSQGLGRLLGRLLETRFADADVLVLDLRGRGGAAHVVKIILDLLESSRWNRPVIGLIDGETRSAKEALAYGIKKRGLGLLVGERTAGALLPATFKRLGSHSVLMYPSFDLGRATALIEGKGVPPDLSVPETLPYSSGEDSVLLAGLLAGLEISRAMAPAE